MHEWGEGEGVISPNVRTNEWNKQTESPVAINECKSPSRCFPWIVEDFVVFYFEVFRIFVCAPKFESSAEMTINLFCIIRDVQTVPLPKWVPCPLWRPVSALLSLHILTPPLEIGTICFADVSLRFSSATQWPRVIASAYPVLFLRSKLPPKKYFAACGTWHVGRRAIFNIYSNYLFAIRYVFFSTIMGQK